MCGTSVWAGQGRTGQGCGRCRWGIGDRCRSIRLFLPSLYGQWTLISFRQTISNAGCVFRFGCVYESVRAMRMGLLWVLLGGCMQSEQRYIGYVKCLDATGKSIHGQWQSLGFVDLTSNFSRKHAQHGQRGGGGDEVCNSGETATKRRCWWSLCTPTLIILCKLKVRAQSEADSFFVRLDVVRSFFFFLLFYNPIFVKNICVYVMYLKDRCMQARNTGFVDHSKIYIYVGFGQHRGNLFFNESNFLCAHCAFFF